MIDESEIAPDVESIVLINPQDMLTIDSCGDTIDDTDDLTCTDMFSGKQSLSMDWTVINVE